MKHNYVFLALYFITPKRTSPRRFVPTAVKPSSCVASSLPELSPWHAQRSTIPPREPSLGDGLNTTLGSDVNTEWSQTRIRQWRESGKRTRSRHIICE